MHSGLIDAPNLSPPCGIPPINPGSTVKEKRFSISSSFATLETASGIPIPILTTCPSDNSIAALLPIIFLSFKFNG